MVHLTQYASNMYSQYGEDGIIEEILSRLELGPGFCVEFGASDGLACSNTAKLWRHEDWEALLIEGNQAYEHQLITNLDRTKAKYKIGMVNPGNVDALIGRPHVDLMSIDIDGDDFHVFCSMQTRATILLVEYNKTIPPHIDLVPNLGSTLGIGSLTLKNAAEQRGYTLLGLTDGSAIFVDTASAWRFADIEKSLGVLQPPESFMYMATDFEGRILPLGTDPPWGLAWPQSSTQFRPNQDQLLTILAIDQIERLIQGIDGLNIDQQQVEQVRSAAMQIALDMRGGYNEALRARIEEELGLR